MNNHTPAPWLVQFDRDQFDSAASDLRVIDGRSLVHPQGALTIATINVAAHAPHLDEPLANAALIAAAPLLYRALGELLELADMGEVDEDTKPVVEAAKAALAAASGAAHIWHADSEALDG